MTREGVIKFGLRFREVAALPAEQLRELNAWRRILFLLGLTGRDPLRYDGLAYGNVSRRLEPFDAPSGQRRFVVSGTQTGGLDELGAEHYALVTGCDPQRNRVAAEGPIRPSSEALTHGTLYRLDDTLRFVMHVHSPEIWRHAGELGIPCTDRDAAYGTPEMAAEVERLFADPAVCKGGLFAMGGHEDGLVAFGRTAEVAGKVLLCTLARALQLSSVDPENESPCL